MKTIRTYLLLLAAWLIAVVICSPIVLLFTTGEHGEPTIWNLVGLVYLAALIFAAKQIFRS